MQISEKRKVKKGNVDKNGLTKQHHAFVREYIRDYNGYAAAVRAKYSARSARSQASILLTKQNIQEAIGREEKKLQNRFYATKEKILRELNIIGFSDIADYVNVDAEGTVSVKAFDQLPLALSRAIKSVKEKKKKMQVGEDNIYVTDIQTEFVLHDKIAALLAAGKELCMFKERHELTGKDGGPIKVEDITDEQLLLIIARAGGHRTTKAKAIKGKPA